MKKRKLVDAKKEMRILLQRYFPNLCREDLLALLPFDLDRESPYEHRQGLIVFKADELLIADGVRDVQIIPTSDVDALEFRQGVGACFLYARRKNGCETLLCRATAGKAQAVSRVAKEMNRRLAPTAATHRNGMPIPDPTCPKCGRRLPRGSDVCIHCTGRRKTLLRLISLARPYRFFIFTAVFLFLAVSLVNLINPYLNKKLVDEYITLPNAGEIEGIFFGFSIVILLILCAQILQHFLSFLRGYCLIHAGNRMIVELREKVFRKIQSLSISKVSRRTSGELMSRVTRDTETLREFLTGRLADLMEQVLIIVVVSVILFVYDWRLALFILLPTPFVVLSFRLFWRAMGAMFHRRWQLNSEANAILHDIFSGIRVVKSFGMEHREAARFEGVIHKEMDTEIRQERIWAIIMPLLQFFIGIGEFILLYFVGNSILDGSMTLGDMTMFSAYVGMIYAPLRTFAHLPREILRVLTASSKIFELLDEKTDVPDAENATEKRMQGQVTLSHVSFGYDDSKEVLSDICLDIQPGEFIGLVGRSGVGKSTLINLIMRLYDVEEGEIKIDGVDIRAFSQESLRSQIGVVLQETFLFTGSVADNISYAKPDATREEIIAAAKTAGCHDMIVRLPDGYQTKIGEKGHTLSGGERQRIAIARALLHDPKILILDEATAALDTETEKSIQDALAALSSKRTTIAIAHRLSTLRNATKLVVLEDGKIVQTGTHDQLMEEDGVYKSLVLAQRDMSRMTDEPMTTV